MGVNDFLMNYYGAYRNAASQQTPDQTGTTVGLKMPKSPSGGLGIAKPLPAQPGTSPWDSTAVTSNPTLAGQYPASMMQYGLMNDMSTTDNNFNQAQSQNQQNVAAQYNTMAAGEKNTNSYGVQANSPLQSSDYNSQQLTNLGTITQVGSNALQGAQNAQQYQQQQNAINANAGYNVSYSGAAYDSSYLPAGSTSNNAGAQAVALAMTAMNNKVPYVWGGTSLSKGVDCSGLVQQIYSELGYQIPRTTYEQAKSGTVIKGLNNAMPGDLIFYNTGSADPNGIGVNSHVGLYMGNGMIIEADNPQKGIIEAPIGDYNGTIVRPW